MFLSFMYDREMRPKLKTYAKEKRLTLPLRIIIYRAAVRLAINVMHRYGSTKSELVELNIEVDKILEAKAAQEQKCNKRLCKCGWDHRTEFVEMMSHKSAMASQEHTLYPCVMYSGPDLSVH